MKRSEMIKLIRDTFEYEGLGVSMREKDAIAILDKIEEAGMLPPEREVVVDNPCDYFLHIDLINEWEKE